MKINSINQNNSFLYLKRQKQIQKDKSEFVSSSIDTHFYMPIFKSNPVAKLNKLTLNEIKTLSLKEIEQIRGTGENLIKKAIIHKFCAESIKQHLNETFGKDNYVVISIGRSLSSICKYLGYIIGEDNVKQVPLSNANRFYIENFNEKTYKLFIDDLKRDEGLPIFREYLKSIGLTKEEVENSGKNFIILDYCCSGKSLEGATNLLKSDLVLGNKKDNIHSASISSMLGSKRIGQNEYLTQDALSFLAESCLTRSNFKTNSFVGSSMELADTIQAGEIKFNNEQKQEFVKIFLEGESLGINVEDDEAEIFLKKCFDSVQFPNQKIFSWENRASQFKKDIRNQYTQLIKLIIDEESKSVKSKEYFELEKDIKDICRYLNQAEKHTSNMCGYYQIKKDIDCILNKFN